MNKTDPVLTRSKTGNDTRKPLSSKVAVEDVELDNDLNASRKEISLLWGEQTRYEMDESELARLGLAKRLIRKRQFARAKAVLQFPCPTSSESLNVLGIIHEALKEFDSARECYGQARSKDKNCQAARLNGQRIYELHLFGRSAIPVYL